MPRCLGGFALSWMACILGRESVQQTMQPFQGTRSIPRSLTPGGTNNGNDIFVRLLLMQVFPSCHN